MAAPPIVDAFTIRGDADRLRQITWNLVSNAIKFTPAGGQIAVSLMRQDQMVRLSVRDSGIGITKEFLPHVFERFRQADSSTTRTHGGVGLGLAIVRHLVELHGGTIDVTSEGRNLGAQFVVSFPIAPIAPMSATVPVVSSPALPVTRLDGVRILVVDDDPNTLDLLTEALMTSGAQVTAAGSARTRARAAPRRRRRHHRQRHRDARRRRLLADEPDPIAARSDQPDAGHRPDRARPHRRSTSGHGSGLSDAPHEARAAR